MPYRDMANLALHMPRAKLSTWNERLSWAMSDREVRNAELARACKIERASVTEWRNGKTKDPKLAPFFAACEFLRIRPRWLALGEEPIEPLPDDAVQHPTLPALLAQIAEALAHHTEEEQRRVLEIVLHLPASSESSKRPFAIAR